MLAWQYTGDLVEKVKRGELRAEIAPDVRSAGTSVISTNNIEVMFLTFAGGITSGLYTVWVVVQNGALFSALFGLLLSLRRPWGGEMVGECEG